MKMKQKDVMINQKKENKYKVILRRDKKTVNIIVCNKTTQRDTYIHNTNGDNLIHH